MIDNQALPWLRALQDVKDDGAWVAAINNAADSAVFGLLRRCDLPDPELRTARIEVIQRARENGTVTQAHLLSWRDDVRDVALAVDGINDFHIREPLVRRFCVTHDLTLGNLDNMLEEVCDALWRGDLPLQDWVEFLDSKRHEAYRELFLFRAASRSILELKRWSDSQFRSAQLSRVGLVGSSRFVWRTAEPTLIAVKEGGPGESLELRWIGWRCWERDDSALGKKEIKEKRCLTLVRIDLEGGRVDLQMQPLDAGGMAALVAEKDLYVHAMVTLLQTQLEPVPLEPAMRALLNDKNMTVSSWWVRLPDGGELKGRGGPGLFQKVRFGFQRFYALEVDGEWKTTAAVRPSISMNARTDAINVHSHCDPTVLDSLNEIIRRQAEAAPQVAISGTMEKDAANVDLQRWLANVVAYERRLGHTAINLDQPSKESNGLPVSPSKVSTDFLFSPSKLREVLDQVGVQIVGVMLYVMCPGTKEPVRQNGGMITFERPSAIPEAIKCENEPGQPQFHQTKGNIYLMVGHHPATSPRYAVAVAAFFAVLLTLLVIVFVWVRTQFPEQRILTWLGFLVLLIVMLTVLIVIFGSVAVNTAVGIVQGLLGRKARQPRAKP
jgi:hypothetical protein